MYVCSVCVVCVCMHTHVPYGAHVEVEGNFEEGGCHLPTHGPQASSQDGLSSFFILDLVPHTISRLLKGQQ